MSDQFQASATDLAAVRDVCEAHGFCLVKNALNPARLPDLLAGMKTAAETYQGKTLPDLLGLPDVRPIYFEPRLLAIARALLGPRLVYDGEGTMNYEEGIAKNTLNPFMVLHCDAVGMRHDIRAVWQSPADAIYRGYRFGVYFQDYRQASGALKVIVGSHRGDPAAYNGAALLSDKRMSKSVGGGQTLAYYEPYHQLHNLPSQPGDVVVWNLRTFHSAGAKVLACDPALALHPDIEKGLADSPGLFAPPPGPRNAVFFDYAAPGEDIDLYIKYRARSVPQSLPTLLARGSDDAAAMAMAAANGLEIRCDGIIMALATDLATRGRLSSGMTDAEKMAQRKRLYRLALSHQEYSPYFPLFDSTSMSQAASPNAAVDSVIRDVVKTLKAEGVLTARPAG